MSSHDSLVQCFHASLDLPSGQAVEGLRYQGIKAWDSVGHMRLVAAIETKFDVMFTTDQILDMSSYDKAVEILESHGISFGS